MPAHKKLLPRPCPQCGLENGGMQWVIFNPRFSNSYEYNKRPYAILRISHYSSEFYNLSSNKVKRNRTKIWHNFRMLSFPGIRRETESGESKHLDLNEIFDEYDYKFKPSITLPVPKVYFDSWKKYGWPRIDTEKAHFIKKGNLKKCQNFLCDNYVKELHRVEYPDKSYSWVCDKSCPEYLARVEKQKLSQNIK